MLPLIFMPAPTKNQKIEALVKLAQKRCRGAGLPKPPQRSVFETLMYAALLENTTFDKADMAFTVLENYYIDWNEIRVCSVRELADTLMDLPQPEAAADRIRRSLQGIFEKMYTFDLEEMRKKGKPLADHIKTLESMSAGTPFMINYVAQIALDGHLFPFDEASLRIMRRLGLSQVSSDGTQEVCIGLDRVILKKAALTFTAQLHHFAAGFYDVPDSPELLSLLSAIDPAAVERSWVQPVMTPVVVAVPVPSAPAEQAAEPVTPPEKPETPPKTPKKAAPAAKPAKTEKPAKAVEKPAKAPPVKKAPPKKAPVKKEPVKKVAEKKSESPAKPTKTPKPVSPSQALRKQKPK